MSIKLVAENYRVLRKIEWELPQGVCALVGPNGSGKSTLLELIELLKDMLSQGIPGGLSAHGTYQGLRNIHAVQSAKLIAGIDFGDLRWQVQLALQEQTYSLLYDELVWEHGELVIDRNSEKPQYTYRDKSLSLGQERSALSILGLEKYRALRPGWDSEFSQPLAALAGFRLYRPYHLDALRKNGSKISTDTLLGIEGSNVFSVLRNWRDKRATKDRYEFVVEGMRDAFPDVFDAIDFDPSESTVSARVIAPGTSEPLPVLYAPSGLLTGLLHLTAVASATSGGIVAIDEPENGLHPYAIKRIVGAMRQWADEHDLTILLATHSTVLIDLFKDETERLFVMEPARDVLPVRLDQVRDRDWLAQFSLGDLYKQGDFGAPLEGASVPA